MAFLVARVRPRPLANTVVAALFVANAVLAANYALREASAASWWSNLLGTSNAVSVWALLLIPFVFPRRRLSRPGERALFAVAGLGVAFTALRIAGGVPLPVPGSLEQDLVLYLALLVGIPLFLDAYLQGPGHVQRNQAKLFLGAYMLKAATVLFVSQPFGGDITVAPLPLLTAAALAAALLAPPLAFAASRLRRGPRPERPWADDALVLGIAALAVVLPPSALMSSTREVEYLLVRPLLFTYAILQYQLLDVDLRRQGPVFASVLAAGTVIAFATVANSLGAAGIAPGVAGGFALLAALAAAGAVGWPLLRLALAPAAAEPRARDLYRAALEASLLGNPDHAGAGEEALRTLRRRLGLGQREAALAELEVRHALGRSPAGGQGPLLGRYRVERVLGEGAHGRTYLAWDGTLERRVVLKVARLPTPEERGRLLREARILARLDDPAIVRVLDAEEAGAEVLLVLEHMAGGSLADRLARGPLRAHEAVALAHQLLQGLEAAHAAGVVHRDVKPANVLFASDGRAKLADFGVAARPDGLGTVSGFSVASSSAGTLQYMSPEQVRGLPLDGRSDLYALGAVLHEALTGRPYLAFEGRSWYDAVNAIVEEPPALPARGVPAAWNRLLADLLAKDPAQRPADAAAARRRLAPLLAGAPRGERGRVSGRTSPRRGPRRGG